MLPKYYVNPFIQNGRHYNVADIHAKITVNDLQLVMFKDIITAASPHNKAEDKLRILGADTRYPPIIYKKGDKYHTYDGRHRLLKLKLEGKTATVCFILKPHVFDNLEVDLIYTPCDGCEE